MSDCFFCFFLFFEFCIELNFKEGRGVMFRLNIVLSLKFIANYVIVSCMCDCIM